MYHVNIYDISEKIDHGDAYIPPKFWINFEKYAESLVDWDAVFSQLGDEGQESPVVRKMKQLLRGTDITLMSPRSGYTLIFEDEADFLFFKLKWG